MPTPTESLTATPSTIRAINRATVLNLVRLHEPVSRKEISTLSGLFPSNVSAVVDDLLGESLLLEQRAKPLKPGRTPVHLFLNPARLRVAGISIRAEKTTVAWAGLPGRIGGSESFATPARPEPLVQEIGRALRRLRQAGAMGDGRLHAMGVSVPGLVDPAQGVVSMSPALPRLGGFPLASALAAAVDAPVLIENDSNVTMLGEQWFAHRELADLENAVLLSISDFGVGSGLTFGSALYRGHNQTWAGEFGHMVVDPDGPRCSCGRRGCWERLICNEATWQRYDPKRNYSVSGFDRLLDQAVAGDARALRAVEETAEYLALGLSNITFILNPDAIVVAGALTRVWNVIQRVLAGSWQAPGIASPVRLSQWSLDELHIRGAIALALQDVFAPPRIGFQTHRPRTNPPR